MPKDEPSGARQPSLVAWARAQGIAAALLLATGATAQPATGVGPSGLPIPRFVSVKSDPVNLRSGPGTEYPTSWVFRRAGLPVEVLKEHEGWRQVRASDGTVGWVFHALLSSRRTALVTPWEQKPAAQPGTGGQAQGQRDGKATSNVQAIVLHAGESASSGAIARVEPGVLAVVRSCDGAWCEVLVGDYRGFIEQKRLWGVYPGEIVR